MAEVSRQTQSMLRDSLNSLVRLDPQLARAVCARDAEVNELKRAFRTRAEQEIQAHPAQTHVLLKLIGAVRNLERVADLATNIAENVVYMVDGRIIRHQGASTGPSAKVS